MKTSFARVGYSKERGVDAQVVVGLLVDRHGFPLEIGCFEGNKAETLTIIAIRAAVHVGSRVTKAPKDLESHFRWHGTAFTDGQVIDTITPRDQRGTAVKTSDPNCRPEPPSRARPGPKPCMPTRGAKGYVTNIEAGLMPAGEVIASYHDLWHVEQVLHDVEDRPGRPADAPPHPRGDRAHLTIVFAALAIARYLQNVTGLRIKKIVRALRPIQQMTVRIAGHEQVAEDPITPVAEAILDALGISTQ
ncbi:hypothetical protein GCM10023350_16800 [Nocardioides endophyticus]|uniref:IS1634 family transposase n=1 Tax=Nocardioides endophyticus TaxID=1353775 RepID=A0ABP8YNU1_9ACTN